MYDKLVIKVCSIKLSSTSELVSKTQYKQIEFSEITVLSLYWPKNERSEKEPCE